MNPHIQLSGLEIDNSWTLFLDRDGVINEKIEGDYVRSQGDLNILPGVTKAINSLSKIFGLIIIVTNQRGIARGFFSEGDLAVIHETLTNQITAGGGKMDAIFYCPHLSDDPGCNCRKPKPGMALQAKHRFPQIDFHRSFMVGDSESDMVFGKNTGMITVKISPYKDDLAKFTYSSLLDFSTAFS